MNFKKIVAELKRRNVFKVATAYAITSNSTIQFLNDNNYWKETWK